MSGSQATRAYGAAANLRSGKQQEADVFRRATGALRNVAGSELDRTRALAENRLLWSTVIALMKDPANALSSELRAGIVSVGMAVQRELDRPAPDVNFIIAVNESMTAGLAA